ncbi:MAG: hypothetical protein M5R40_24135 [Anaerolineae bacterium]|nr:hypothetical protein [Anaerolineae bacterium]
MSAHILIIDPDASFAGMMSQGLRALAGYEVTLAHSGRDALAKLPAAGPVDLAILDLGTDDIAPAALIDALRAHRPGLPVLVIPIAGDAAPTDLPVQGAFAKPPFLPDLPALIDRALGRETAVPEPATPAAATVEEILAAPGVAPVEERATAPGGHQRDRRTARRAASRRRSSTRFSPSATCSGTPTTGTSAGSCAIPICACRRRRATNWNNSSRASARRLVSCR